jgi:thiol-disulfide isomerase/thioredoxin
MIDRSRKNSPLPIGGPTLLARRHGCIVFGAENTERRGPRMKIATIRSSKGLFLTLLLAFTAALTLLMLASGAAAATEEASGPAAPTAGSAKPYVVMIHADWCGTCKALKSVWRQIQTDLADESTAVTFDVTDRPAYAESLAAAQQLGIAAFFHDYRSKTGTIAVLSCKTREPVAIMGGERDLEAYRAAIAKAACKAS